MPDKKYKELMTRLDQSKKQGGNFRSYTRIQQDVRASEQKEKNRSETSADKRDKRSQASKSPKKNYFLENLIKMAIPFIVVILLIIAAVYFLTNKNATEISVNGEVIGHLKPAGISEGEFLKTLTAKIEETENTKIKINDKITLAPIHGKGKLLMDDSQIMNLLADSVNYQVLAAEISVDGVTIGTAKNQDEAKSIFDSLMAPFITDGENTTAEFVEDVVAADVYVSKDDIDESDTIRAELSKTSQMSAEYEIVSGDTLSKIAAINGITVNDIKDSNPGLDVSKPLQVGQKLHVISTAPYVSVKTIERHIEMVDIPMPSPIEQPDSTLEAGKTRIVEQGTDGKKEVVTQIVKINGVVMSTSDISEKIVVPAKPRTISVGTG